MRLFILLTAVLFFTLPLSAEVNCRADVTYSWKRDKDEQPSVVVFGSIEQTGSDEAATKLKLVEIASREIPKALAHCKKQHENEAGCLASKFSASSQSTSSLSFSARKAVESAIVNDCQAQQGPCVSAAHSEPQCKEIISASATPVAEAGKDAKPAKEEKKKK
jgi:hypothetical protein